MTKAPQEDVDLAAVPTTAVEEVVVLPEEVHVGAHPPVAASEAVVVTVEGVLGTEAVAAEAEAAEEGAASAATVAPPSTPRERGVRKRRRLPATGPKAASRAQGRSWATPRTWRSRAAFPSIGR